MGSEAPVNDQASLAASAAPLPLHSDVQAAQLVALCNRFQADLFDWLDAALPGEPGDHAVPLKRAVSHVAFELTDRLLYPAYLQRPALVPAQLREGI